MTQPSDCVPAAGCQFYIEQLVDESVKDMYRCGEEYDCKLVHRYYVSMLVPNCQYIPCKRVYYERQAPPQLYLPHVEFFVV